MSKSRVVVFGVAALLLAACGPVHPGSAAVVDGDRISMQQVDDYAESYCLISLLNAAQSGTTAIDNSMIRRQAVSDLVVASVADSIAAEENYKVAIPEMPAEDLAQITELFGSDAEAVLALIERNQRISAIATEVAKDAGVKVEDETALPQAGFELLTQAAAKADVSIDPRFGLDDDVQPVAETGSLSVSSLLLDGVSAEELPKPLQCTA